MRRQRGMTMIELVTVIMVFSVLAGTAVPGVVRVKASMSGSLGARRLAIVLRAAQARAQSRDAAVRVTLDEHGQYTVADVDDDEPPVGAGRLDVAVQSTYPGGAVEFTPAGWPRAPGTTSPRAGHFVVSGGPTSRTVVVQLSGCVRCR